MNATKIELLECTLRNFQSYGNNVTKFNLSFDEPTLISGKNFDSVVNGQIDSNGSGKTTLLHGIVYACYGKALDPNIKLPKLVNNINNKDMEVTLTFKRGDIYYKIIRFRKNKARGGDGVKLLISKGNMDFTEDVKDNAKDSIANTNVQITEILGMPFEIFTRILVFSATHDSFLSLPASHAHAANQRDIIEELFNLTLLTKKGAELKLKIKDDTLELNNAILIQDKAEEEAERYRLQLEKAKERKIAWDKDTKNTISNLKQKKDVLSNIDFNLEENNLDSKSEADTKLSETKQKLSTCKSECSRLSTDIESATKWDTKRKKLIKRTMADIENLELHEFDINRELFILLDKLDSKLVKLSSKEREMSRDIKGSLSTIEGMEEEKGHLETSKCPYCKQTFKEAKVKLKKLLKTLESEQTKLDESNEKFKSFEAKKKKINKKLDAVRDELEFDSLREMEKLESNLVQLNKTLKEKRNEGNPYTIDNGIHEMVSKRDLLVDSEKKLNKKVKKIEKSISKIKCQYTSHNELFKDKLHFEQLDGEIEKLKNDINPHIETVTDIENIELDESKIDIINDLHEEIKHSKFLLKVLTKKDSYLRKGLLKEKLPYLNDQLKYYLGTLGLPHKVTFMDDMTVNISQFSKEIDFANLSNGQKARVNLALSFAFRDVLQNQHFKVNFCILDECLDVGLSDVGVVMATKMLKTVARDNELSMYIISHRDEVSSMFDNKLNIELKRGFSSIVP